jgi:nucleoside 2-deoxyribosyltransferase
MNTNAAARCYVASSLGFTEAGREYYYRVYLPTLATVVEPVDPWALIKSEEVAAAQTGTLTHEMSVEIGRRNCAAIRSSDMFVAYLDGQDPATMGEMGFAAGLGLRCIGLRTDLREAGGGGTVSRQIEAFIVESGGSIHASLDDLVTGLRQLASSDALAA